MRAPRLAVSAAFVVAMALGTGLTNDAPAFAKHPCTKARTGQCIKVGHRCSKARYGKSGWDAAGRVRICKGSHAKPRWRKLGKFDQTWKKSYGKTKCDEWLNDMTQRQNFIAAADMLVGSQEVDGGTGLPSDSLIKRFRDDITSVCETDYGYSQPLTDMAVFVYLTDKPTYKP